MTDLNGLSKQLERVADGVWLIRGGFVKKTMNVYLIEYAGKVTVFDGGIKAMTKAVAEAATSLGGGRSHRARARARRPPRRCAWALTWTLYLIAQH